MYKHFLSPVLILLAFALGGCHKNEFKVEFSLSEKISNNYTVLYYASNPEKGMIREQVAVVAAGKGELQGVTYNPTLVYFFIGGRKPEAVAYIERGDKLKISGDDASPVGWMIAGNPITESLSKWRIENREILAAGNKEKINSAVKSYVGKNADNPASTLLLLLYYDKSINEAGFNKLWKMLKGVAAEEKWSTLVGRADLLTGMDEPKEKMGVMIFRGEKGRRDTVDPKKGKVLLCFLDERDAERRQMVDNLKKIVKSRKDSAKSVIVVIGFEPDSTTWRYKLRSDSLKGVVRAWMPLGYNDSLAISLGVKSLPALFETDTTGKVKRLNQLPID